ncbi:BTB/POZ domain-containing protein 6-B-like [Paramacrobiotus metropolitanus]|uniref:BTB/POZ domain-containing protein 6-B-like n=1 Tax=Paramacrobiotus metropolitanus TaxID=2943436 RepID=UPI002445E3EB|nr:BTB/POZ domain-containing protein 6-B-like [Paramacrobiotus metropolitanus]
MAKHASRNGDLLQHILASGEMSDVQFAVGRKHGPVQIFSAHKFVLSLTSDVFYTMFNGGLAESGDSPISIPEILPDAFANMLKFLYTRSLNGELTEDNVFQTMYCADKYNLPLLLELCLKFVNTHLKADNCLMFLEKAKHSMLECTAGFVDNCLVFIDAHGSAVLQSEQFSAVGRDILEMVVQRSTLSADENIVYTAVEKWSVNACVRDNLEPSPTSRREMLGPALFLVRFPLLSDAQLANGPVKSGLLLDSELREIYRFKHSDTKPSLPFPTEFRKGSIRRTESCPTELRFQVFADFDGTGAYWHLGKVVKMADDGEDCLVVQNEPTDPKRWIAVSRLVWASDILKNGQKIMCLDREVSYVACQGCAEHIVDYGNRNYMPRPFYYLGMSRAQMAAWKASMAQ